LDEIEKDADNNDIIKDIEIKRMKKIVKEEFRKWKNKKY